MKLRDKLSFALGLRSLLLVSLLGLLMAFQQTYFDFKNRTEDINASISSIIDSNKASASRAVYLMDPNLAEQIVKGLSLFEYFSYVSLVDDRGETMSEIVREELRYINPILSLVAPNYTEYNVDVGEGNFSGKLILQANNHVALKEVYQRAIRTFSISLLGYMLLSLALVLLYHNSLAVPLTRLAKRLQRVNTSSITEQSIAHIKGHESNEFSLIVDSANDLLNRIASGQLLLTQRSQRFRLILDTAPLLIFAIDNNGLFAFANKSTAAFYGYSIFDLKGKNAQGVIEEIDSELNKKIASFIESDHRQLDITCPMFNANKEKTIHEVSLVKFHTFDGQSLLAVCNDVTKRIEAEAQIEDLAYKDPLTKLPNRNRLFDILKEPKPEQDADKYDVAILADLDQFKRINDTLSHSVGDTLIVELCEELLAQFSSTGVVGRLGADEFLYFRENLSNDFEVAKIMATEIAEKVRLCINKDIKLSMHKYSLSASIGVVVFRRGEHSADLILQHADTAMYESKKRGRNCVTMFKDEMAMQAAKLLQLERDITTAMKEDQFCFVLQPIYDSSSSSIVCAEALIRWQKGDETISPDSFIPFLEESSLIIEVGDIMLDKVCAFLSMLKTEGKLEEDFRIAVNISGKQFSDDRFLERVIGILRKHQVAGHHLELEITESVALENLADTIDKIYELKKLKISFSLDDFGTGYSSLSHLKDLPVDKLKIDRSFINDISIDKQDENLVRSIIQLSDNLGLVTVAEGVETQQQLDWLCSTGHLLIQGYLFSKPLSPDIFYSKFFRDE